MKNKRPQDTHSHNFITITAPAPFSICNWGTYIQPAVLMQPVCVCACMYLCLCVCVCVCVASHLHKCNLVLQAELWHQSQGRDGGEGGWRGQQESYSSFLGEKRGWKKKSEAMKDEKNKTQRTKERWSWKEEVGEMSLFDDLRMRVNDRESFFSEMLPPPLIKGQREQPSLRISIFHCVVTTRQVWQEVNIRGDLVKSAPKYWHASNFGGQLVLFPN